MGKRLDVPNKGLLQRTLKREILRSSESRFLHRLHCVLLVGQCHSCYGVAEWFGESPRTVERWVHQFEEAGIEGLRSKPKSGRPSKLGSEQLEQLRREINKGPIQFGYDQERWDVKLLGAHVSDHFGITLSIRHCQRLLRACHQDGL